MSGHNRFYTQSKDIRSKKGKQYVYYKLSRRSPELGKKTDHFHIGRKPMSEARLALFNEDWGGDVIQPHKRTARFYAVANEAELEAYRMALKTEREINEAEELEERKALKQEALENLDTAHTFTTEEVTKYFVANEAERLQNQKLSRPELVMEQKKRLQKEGGRKLEVPDILI